MPETQASQLQDCVYTRLDNGIHEFIFNNPNRQAVDKHFDILEEIYAPLAKGDTVPVLIVFPNGMPPMSYVFGRAREFNSRHAGNRGFYAFTYARQNMMLSILQSFFRMLPGGNMGGFFPAEERNKAIEWLLAKQG